MQIDLKALQEACKANVVPLSSEACEALAASARRVSARESGVLQSVKNLSQVPICQVNCVMGLN